MKEPSEPFRWPKRASSPGCVHIVIGESRYVGREQMACNMNLLKAGYDRTVDPVTCVFCLEALREARVGDRDEWVHPVDRAILMTLADTEAKRGIDETIALEAEVRPANT